MWVLVFSLALKASCFNGKNSILVSNIAIVNIIFRKKFVTSWTNFFFSAALKMFFYLFSGKFRQISKILGPNNRRHVADRSVRRHLDFECLPNTGHVITGRIRSIKINHWVAEALLLYKIENSNIKSWNKYRACWQIPSKVVSSFHVVCMYVGNSKRTRLLAYPRFSIVYL